MLTHATLKWIKYEEFFCVEAVGLEPTTRGTKIHCSATELRLSI